MVKELKIMFAQKLICSWVGALGLAAGAFCQTYVQIYLGDGRYTVASDINRERAVVGFYSALGTDHGFVRDPGGMIMTIDVPGSSYTTAVSINDEGAVTGHHLVNRNRRLL
jgi:hypothetical protein